MKKIITSALIILFLFCCCVFASDSCSLKVSITDFSYSSDTLPAGGSLEVSCNIKQIYEGSQNYMFFVLVTSNGEYFDHYETSGILKNNVPEEISGSVSIPSDTNGVLVETFVWDSLSGGKAIAPYGVFTEASSSENSLEKLYVDGNEIEVKENMKVSYSSVTHTPNISPVAKDSASKVEIDEITSIPQDVNIKVTAQNGDVKNYVLSIEVAEGKITNAYQINSSNSKVNMTTDEVRYPVFPEGAGPADMADGYKTVVPSKKTHVFNDRTFYVVDIPESLIGKTMIQPSYQLFGYDALYQDKTKGDTDTGFFTIDRTADVYVYGVHDATDWIVSQKYEKLGTEYKTTRTANTIAPTGQTGYKKRFVVEEGETRTITLGGATSADGIRDSYYIIVDFINPVSFVEAKSINIEGIGSVELKPDVYEYEFVVMEDINPVIECELLGVGATYEYTVSENETGKTAEVVVTSGDESSTLTYKLNFVNFSEALKEIKVDGALIDGFDNAVSDYTYGLPFGSEEPKEVTASIISHPDIELVVEQATEANPTATVTVRNTVTNEELVYTVSFVMSNTGTITPSISYLGSDSKCSQGNGSAFRFLLSVYDNQITTNLLKIDISSLKDKSYINENTKFTLNLNAKMQRTLETGYTDAGLNSMTIKAVPISGELDWAEETANRASNTYTGTGDGSDYKTYITGKTPAATASLPFTGAFETVSLDISSVIYSALQNNQDYAYIAFAGDLDQKNQFSSEHVKSIVFYYYITGNNAPTLTLEINE